MTKELLTQADFSPLPDYDPPPGVQINAAIPGWRQVLARIWAKKTARVALLYLCALLLLTVTGSLLWPVDPDLQNIAQLSRPPQGAVWARVIDVAEAQHDRQLSAGLDELTVLDAHTEGVSLAWPAQSAARHLRLYRRDAVATAPGYEGILLAELDGAAVFYRDRLNLAPQRYEYSLWFATPDQQWQRYQRITVQAVQAISRFDVELMGLTPRVVDGIEQVYLPAHPLGTDQLGRDILARLLAGARISLAIGLLAPLFYIAFGALYGGIAAYRGGWLDELMMRAADFVIGLPFLLFMILFKVVFGLHSDNSGMLLMLVAIILLSWPESARLVRGQILQLRSQPYVEAARLMGAGSFHIIRYHMLPQLAGTLLVSFSFAVPTVIFTEAFLSFIGMGIVPPAASWGTMCEEGMRNLFSSPHILLAPALAISLTVIAFNQLGDALRDAISGERGDSA